MPRSLPASPSYRFIQLEAKDILKAFKKGDIAVCDIIRRHSRYSKSKNKDILKSKISLQEVQHALSLDYGFQSWADLKTALKKRKFDERNKDYAIVKRPKFDMIVAKEGRYTFGEGGNVNEVSLLWNELFNSADYPLLMDLNTAQGGPNTSAEILSASIFDPGGPPYVMTYSIGIENVGAEIPDKFKTIHIPAATWVVFYGRMPAINDYAENEWFPKTGNKHADGPILEVLLPAGTGNQVWMPIEGDVKEVPLKSNISARIPAHLWEEFEDICLEADQSPDKIMTKLIEQYLKKSRQNQ